MILYVIHVKLLIIEFYFILLSKLLSFKLYIKLLIFLFFGSRYMKYPPTSVCKYYPHLDSHFFFKFGCGFGYRKINIDLDPDALIYMWIRIRILPILGNSLTSTKKNSLRATKFYDLLYKNVNFIIFIVCPRFDLS